MTPEQAAEKIILAIPSHALFCLFPSERDGLEKAINEAIHAQRAEAVAEATKWQPISTAPRDGTMILLLIAEQVVLGKWMKSPMGTVSKWYVAGLHGRIGNATSVDPDAWMPLPPAPQEGEG